MNRYMDIRSSGLVPRMFWHSKGSFPSFTLLQTYQQSVISYLSSRSDAVELIAPFITPYHHNLTSSPILTRAGSNTLDILQDADNNNGQPTTTQV